MKRPFLQYRRRNLAAAVLVVLAMVVSLHGAFPPGVQAFTPESPEVQETVAHGIAFLESDAAEDNRMGARALVGLTLYKNHARPEHPKIVQAVKAIQDRVKGQDPAKLNLGTKRIYDVGLAVIFLATLDPNAYASEIKCLVEFLRLQQKAHGGWGYPRLETGDTSMTQYGVLSMWEAGEAGFNVPIESVDNVASWLLKTQDPSGGHAYQGHTSDSFTPIRQSSPTSSMTAAGLGSLYICADLLGVATRTQRPDDGLPAALTEVKEKTPRTAVKVRTRIPSYLFLEAQNRGMGWMKKNYKIESGRWINYSLYALERCMSFRELSERGRGARKAKDGPTWYNDGVRFLIDTQAEDGSWKSSRKIDCGTTPDTAFAVLFLLRSTQKSINRRGPDYGDGLLVGGRGLPKETDGALVREGTVVARPLLGPAEQLLAVLEQSDNSEEAPDYDQAIALLNDLPSQEAAQLVGRHAEQLRRLVGDWSVEARLAAVRALAKARDLDNVPALIYALTDPNATVVRSARDALRRISRRPSGFGLPDAPTRGERLAAIEKWKAWHLAVRPDAQFRPIEFEP